LLLQKLGEGREPLADVPLNAETRGITGARPRADDADGAALHDHRAQIIEGRALAMKYAPGGSGIQYQ
jgi:hypothetical protein